MSRKTKKEKELELQALCEKHKDVLNNPNLLTQADWEKKLSLMDKTPEVTEEELEERLRKPNPALLKKMLKASDKLRSK